MSKAEPAGSFWTSLGGILTGIAAIITAVGGLIGVWYQLPSSNPTPAPLEGTHEKEPTQPDSGSMQGLAEIPIAATDGEPSEQSPETDPAWSPTSGIEVGDSILAEWKADGCLYPGDVREIKDGYYHVYFGFDEKAWIPPEGLVQPITPAPDDVTPEARVYAEVEDVQIRWIPSTVRDVRDGRYYVVFDKDVRCRPRDGRHVWTGIDGIVMSQ